MEKEEININGYILEQPLSNDNSGFSMVKDILSKNFWHPNIQ